MRGSPTPQESLGVRRVGNCCEGDFDCTPRGRKPHWCQGCGRSGAGRWRRLGTSTPPARLIMVFKGQFVRGPVTTGFQGQDRAAALMMSRKGQSTRRPATAGFKGQGLAAAQMASAYLRHYSSRGSPLQMGRRTRRQPSPSTAASAWSSAVVGAGAPCVPTRLECQRTSCQAAT